MILFSFLKIRQEIYELRIQLLQGYAKSRKQHAKTYFLSTRVQNGVKWLNQKVFLPPAHYLILTVLLPSNYTGNGKLWRKLRALSVLRRTFSQQWHCCPPVVLSILRSLCVNEETMSCLCSMETSIVVKEIMFGWMRWKKIKRRWYLNEEGLVPFHSRTEMWQTRD